MITNIRSPHERAHVALRDMAWGLPILLLAPLYGLLPLDRMVSLALMLPTLGGIECLADTQNLLYCPLVSQGTDHAMPYGLPFTLLASIIYRAFPIELLTAYNLTGLVILYLAGLGAQAFLRAMNIRPWLALIGALFFLATPIVYAKSTYPLMMWGFVLMPSVLWLQCKFFTVRSHWLAAALISSAFTLAIFQDPYSFVMALTFGGWWLLTPFLKPAHNTWLFVVTRTVLWILGVLLSVFFYQLYLPASTTYHSMSLDFFRGQGIDLIALLARAPELYALGPFWGVGKLDPWLYFTDGEMTAHSYLGFSLVLCLLIFLCSQPWWRRQKLLVVMLTFLGASVMVLGPSLKINDQALTTIDGGPPTVSQYNMAPEMATASLPHQFIYTLPPFKYMRSVSRWYLAAMLMLIVMGLWVIQTLLNKNSLGVIAATALGMITIVEHWPNFKHRMALGAVFGSHYSTLQFDLIKELNRLVGQTSHVLFIGGEQLQNEYFSTYLCARIGCRTYNASGDKALSIASDGWPEKIRRVTLSPASAEERTHLLTDGSVNALILPHFDMRWDSYRWPPSEKTRQTMMQKWVQPYEDMPCIQVAVGTWFSVARLTSPTCPINHQLQKQDGLDSS